MKSNLIKAAKELVNYWESDDVQNDGIDWDVLSELLNDLSKAVQQSESIKRKRLDSTRAKQTNKHERK